MCMHEGTEQYFPVVQFVLLYSVVLTIESVNETMCHHSNGSHCVILFKVLFADFACSSCLNI